jgi:hypothetical protein
MAANRLFRIQFASNLHLQYYEKVPFPLLVKPAARYLALAGNIGEPHTRLWNSFFTYASSNWDRVYFVPGHEEYLKFKNQPMLEIYNDLQDSLAKWSNVTCFNPLTTYKYLPKENVAVIGNTHDMRKNIDYFTYQKTPMVILTHYAPRLQHGFVSPYIRAWIYGDTHEAVGYQHGTMIYTNNARGYPNEPVIGFTTAATLEFEGGDEEGVNPLMAAAATGVKI